jgi:hypothetical protein
LSEAGKLRQLRPRYGRLAARERLVEYRFLGATGMKVRSCRIERLE